MTLIKRKAKTRLVLVLLLSVLYSWHGRFVCAEKAAYPGYQILDIHFVNKLPYAEIDVEGYKIKVIVSTVLTGVGLSLYKGAFSKLKTVTYTGKDIRTTGLGGDVAYNKIYTLPRFALGSMHFNDLKIISQPQPNSKSVHGSGALGTDLFKEKKLIIDYRLKKFIIMEPDAAPPSEYDIDSWIKVPFIRDNPRITKKDKGKGVYINAAVGESDRTNLFCLATGLPYSELNLNAVGEHKIEQKCYEDGCDKYLDMRPLKVAGQSLGRTLAYIGGDKIPVADGMLGYNFFYNRIVYIDFPNQVMHVKLLEGEEKL